MTDQLREAQNIADCGKDDCTPVEHWQRVAMRAIAALATPSPDTTMEFCARLLHNARFQISPIHNGGSAPFDEPVVPCGFCVLMGARLAFALRETISARPSPSARTGR